MSLGLRYGGGCLGSGMRAKFGFVGFRETAGDRSEGFVAGSNLSGRIVGGGVWSDNSSNLIWTSDGWIRKGSGTGYLRYPFKTAGTKSVEVSARVRRQSAEGNGFLMMFAEGLSGDPGSYVLAGHNLTNGEYQIWTVDAGALTKRASVAGIWNSGEKHLVAQGSLVPGAANPKKIVIDLLVDGVLVLTWQSETGIPAALGNRAGIWIDNTIAGANPTESQSIQFKDVVVKESSLPGKLILIGDSISVGTGTSVPASKNHGAVAAGLLGWSFVNYAVGGSTTAQMMAQVEAAIAATEFDDRAVLIVMAGTNDFDRGAGVPQVMAELARVLAKLRNSGKFVGVGVHTLVAGRGRTSNFRSLRGALNDLLVLRGSELADGVGLAGFDSVIGADSASETLDSATGTSGVFVDELHLNDYGQRLLARYTAELALRVGGN